MSARSLAYTVVVPTYNRPDRLRRCVGALAGLDYDRAAFEVVVVDDGSLPEAHAENGRIVAAAAKELEIRLVAQPNAGPAAARNRGAGEARGELLAFTDDDCAPDPGWLRAFDAAFRERPGALLGGRILNAVPENRCAAASQVVIDFAYDWARQIGHGTGPDGTWLFATANLACPRVRLLAVGGFDATFRFAAGEDYDFCFRYQHQGFPAAYVPEALILHHHAMSLRQFWRQHFAYGRGLLQFRRRVSGRVGRSAQVRFGAFQAGLTRSCLARLHAPDGLLQAGLVGLSQVATLTGAALELVSAASHPPELERC